MQIRSGGRKNLQRTVSRTFAARVRRTSSPPVSSAEDVRIAGRLINSDRIGSSSIKSSM